MIDLSEKDRIMDLITDSPESIEEIIEQTNLGICVTDENGNYSAVNSSYLGITKYSREELVGNNFLLVVPPEHKKELKYLHDDYIEIQTEFFDHFTIINKDGELVSIDVDAGFSDQVFGGPHKITFIAISD